MSYAREIDDEERTLVWSRSAPRAPATSPVSRAATVMVRARPRRSRERRSFMPLVVFAATFAIGFSLGQDDAVHSDVATQLRSVAGHVAAVLVRL